MTVPARLTLLSRPDCHLCHEAAALLSRLEVPFVTIDVDMDAALASRYGDALPVLLLDGRELARAPLEERTVQAALATAGLMPGRR